MNTNTNQSVTTPTLTTIRTTNGCLYAEVEMLNDDIGTFWNVTIYKVNPDGSTEDRDCESFEDFALAEEWAFDQI